MKRQHLELVGLLVTHSTHYKAYHIDYVYRMRISGILEGAAIQKGFDWLLHCPFQEILLALQTAYAPVLQRQWTHTTERVTRVLMALRNDLDPHAVSCGEGWALDYER